MPQLVTAQLNYFRMSPRKMRLVANVIRGHKVAWSLETLAMLNQRAAKPLIKLLNSAVANAKNNFKLEPEVLFIKSIMIDGGPVLKRWMPRAHGRASPIRERTSHVSLVLEEMEKKLAKKKIKK